LWNSHGASESSSSRKANTTALSITKPAKAEHRQPSQELFSGIVQTCRFSKVDCTPKSPDQVTKPDGDTLSLESFSNAWFSKEFAMVQTQRCSPTTPVERVG
jgi:hypothetical protein